MTAVTALVAHGPGDFRLERFERAEPGPDEARLEVAAAGVCAADRRIHDGTAPWPISYPLIPGHEIVGRLAEVGPDFPGGFSPGQAVTVEPIVPCGECHYCRAGKYHLCARPNFFGFHLPGGFETSLILPAKARLHLLPETTDLVPFVLTEPLACAVHCLDRAAVELKETVVVCGVGAISRLMLILLSKRRPLRLVALSGRAEGRDAALALGADEALDPDRDGLVERLAEICGGVGPDVFIEASGRAGAPELGLRSLRKGGRLIVFGVYGQSVELNLNLVGDFKELTVKGVHLSPGAFPAAVRLLAEGVIDPGEQIVAAVSLDRAAETLADRTALARPGKLVFVPERMD